MLKLAGLIIALTLAPLLQAAEPTAAEDAAEHTDWESWTAGNEVGNLSSLQRGARNYMNYCVGCHSLKYLRYSRMAEDLRIPADLLQKNLMPIEAKPADYIVTSLTDADAEAWFGKVPPDLSLMARARHGGADYIYRFLKTFYVDTTRATRTSNLVLEGTAMPAVLSDLGGVQEAVYRNVEKVVDGKTVTAKEFSHFETTTPGRLTPVQYDEFVRDTVNFLDYASEPTQVERRSIGVWVVLFLLMLTWMAWLLKNEYWKDVH